MSLYGLHIGKKRIALVKVGYGWTGKPILRGYRIIGLPEGLIKDSFIESNIPNLRETGEILREHINPKTNRIKNIKLSIPDTTVKVFCLQFPEFPSSKKEIGKLIRYTVEDHLPFTWEETVLRYQVLSGYSGQKHLLAVAIKKTILGEYENLVNSLGLIPLSIGVSSLCRLNFCSKNLRSLSVKDFLMINIFDSYFTIIIGSKGIPVFFRVKPIRNDLSRGELVDRVTMELVNTVSFYKEGHDLSEEASIYTYSPPTIMEELIRELEGLPKGEVKDLPLSTWVDMKGLKLSGEEDFYRISGAIAAALGT